MSYEIEKQSERNVDTPLTNFPVSEDTFNRMMDVTSALMPLVLQYNAYFEAGNMTACNELLKNNPDLKKCFYIAQNHNELRDAIIAMERYLLNQVDELYNDIANDAIGILDNPTDEQASLVAYSADKINKLHKKRTVTLLASGWSTSYPYTQTVVVDGIKSNAEIKVIGVSVPDGATVEQIKAWNKAIGSFMSNPGGVADGAITFKAYKKPVVDVTIITEGG